MGRPLAGTGGFANRPPFATFGKSDGLLIRPFGKVGRPGSVPPQQE